MEKLKKEIEIFCEGTRSNFVFLGNEIVDGKTNDTAIKIQKIGEKVCVTVADKYRQGRIASCTYDVNATNDIVLCISNMLYFGDTGDMRRHETA